MRYDSALIRALGTGVAALAVAASAAGAGPAPSIVNGRQTETLDRGVVAAPAAEGKGILVSWRLLATDPASTGFTVYRDGKRATRDSLTGATAFLDAPGNAQAG